MQKSALRALECALNAAGDALARVLVAAFFIILACAGIFAISRVARKIALLALYLVAHWRLP